MSFVERIKLSNYILHSHLSIFFCLGLTAILVLKMRIENSNFFSIAFLDASSHLYKRPCPSVRCSVRLSVGNAFVQIDKKWPFTDSK